MSAAPRKLPNIILTGTPGVGKTSHAQLLAEQTSLQHFSINDIVKDRNCYEGYDEEFKSYVVDDDKLLDSVELEIKEGGKIIDWHVCDIFPESWIDLVVVLRTDNTTLYDRLKQRNYPEVKLQENLDAEIMQVILEDARESFAEEIVIELHSVTVEDMQNNVDRIVEWVNQWLEDNKTE